MALIRRDSKTGKSIIPTPAPYSFGSFKAPFPSLGNIKSPVPLNFSNPFSRPSPIYPTLTGGALPTLAINPKPAIVPVPSVVTSTPANDRYTQKTAEFNNAATNINSYYYTDKKTAAVPAVTAPKPDLTSVPKPGSTTVVPPQGDITTTGTGTATGTVVPPPLKDNPAKKSALTAPDLSTANTAITADAQKRINELERLKVTMDNTSSALLSSIQQKYKLLEQATVEKNNEIYAGVQNIGIVSGRSRYAPELQSSILSNEVSEGLGRLNALEAEKTSLLIQAQQAKNSDDLKMFNTISDRYDKAQEQQRKVLQDTFDNTIKLENFALSSSKESRAQAEDDLNRLGYADPATISEETYTRLENSLGMPAGFAKKYSEAARTATTADTSKKKAEAQKAYLGLLQEIPAGKTMTFPDGSTMTGLGKVEDLYTFEKEDGNGKVTIVSYDRRTGAMKQYSAGKIGTPSADTDGGGSGSKAADMYSVTTSFLDSFIDPTTGKVGPIRDEKTGEIAKTPDQLLVDTAKAFSQKYPGKLSYFTGNIAPLYWDKLTLEDAGL